MRIPLAIRSSQSDNSSAFSNTRLVNWFPEVLGNDAAAPYALISAPGADVFKATGGDQVSGMLFERDRLYVCNGKRLRGYGIDGTKYVDNGSDVNFSQRVSMASSGIEIVVVGDSAGDGLGWSWNVNTLTWTQLADMPSAKHVAFLDGYFIVANSNSGQFNISGLYDATSWDALDFATAEADADILQTVIANNRELWLIGKRTTEVWTNTGATFPFERSVVIQRGCMAEWSAATLGEIVFWLGDDGIVYLANGYQPQRISTHPVEASIANMTTRTDAYAWTYTQHGHKFYVLTFPSENRTWVFDLITGEWHERESYGEDHYLPSCAVTGWEGRTFAGSYKDGKVFELKESEYTWNGNIIQHEAIFPEVRNELENLQMNKLQIEFEHGVGNVDSAAPVAVLSWSDDGGKTWSNQHSREVGAVGEYGVRAIWRRLGRFKKRQFKLECTDPVKWVVLNAYAK